MTGEISPTIEIRMRRVNCPQCGIKVERVPWSDRTAKTLLRFLRFFGRERTNRFRFVCSDMWKAYLKAIAKQAPQAIHILDQFHVMQQLSKAIDRVRAAESNCLRIELDI